MRLDRDYTLFLPASTGEAACRIRVFLPDARGRDLPVVVCSFVAEHRSLSRGEDPTSEAPDALAPERVAAEVFIREDLPEFVWVSHEMSPESEADDEFGLVVFAHFEIREIVREDGVWRREVGPPTWKPLDRESVEGLVGYTLGRPEG